MLTYNRVAAEVSRQMVGKEIRKGADIREFIPPVKHHETTEDFLRALTGEHVCSVSSVETSLGTKWFDIDLAPVKDDGGEIWAVCLSLVDITELKAAHNRLDEKTQVLHLVIDCMPDIVSLQKPDLDILYCNRTGCELLGVRPEDAVGRKCFELVGRREPCELCACRLSLESGRPEVVEKYSEEHGKWVEVMAVPVFDEEGGISMIVKRLRDTSFERERPPQDHGERAEVP